eukprot:CAMPEP_0116565634 /NCGR_PEP_ID=MMETSP0397-20121206/14006_1 /TAXON_ID=216820 /ORGANISM="Cyclophora tenuis, Strain ECT3854" /LENGTH=319 /DNA_ID=CAMNT_0004092427 /DNA_START=138 /DNA_END=1094 /DNA_ORIENTATION=-
MCAHSVSAEIQLGGLKTLAGLFQENIPAIWNKWDSDLTNTVLTAMKNFRGADKIQLVGCRLIARACTLSSQRSDIAHQDGFNAMIEALGWHVHDVPIQVAGYSALCWLLRDQCSAEDAKKAYEVFANTIIAHKNDPTVLKPALRSMIVICKNGANKKVLQNYQIPVPVRLLETTDEEVNLCKAELLRELASEVIVELKPLDDVSSLGFTHQTGMFGATQSQRMAATATTAARPQQQQQRAMMRDALAEGYVAVEGGKQLRSSTSAVAASSSSSKHSDTKTVSTKSTINTDESGQQPRKTSRGKPVRSNSGNKSDKRKGW